MKTFAKGWEALQGGRLAEAEKHFRAFLAKEPRHVPSLNLLTVVLMTSRRFADAEKYIARAVSIDQTSDASFYNYGLILSSQSKQREAIEQFTKALALNPA